MLMGALIGAWSTYMRAVSAFTRSRTCSCVTALGVMLQPAITAVTASATSVRGNMWTALEKVFCCLLMFKSSLNMLISW